VVRHPGQGVSVALDFLRYVPLEETQGKAAYIRPKVVGPCTSRSYVHRAALFLFIYVAHFFTQKQ
jgi:hypothetical protein